MDKNDQQKLTEWLYLEPDGELSRTERQWLEEAADRSPELAETRHQLRKLTRSLEESRIEVAEDFHAQVMASLPPAPWGARHPRTWWAAAAVIALLGGGAALLTGLSAAELEPASPFLAAMAAVGDMLASSVAAGAGLVGASWRGIGLAFGQWLGASIGNAIAFGVLFVGVHWMLLRRLRRRRRPAPAQSSGTSNRGGVE